MSLSLRTTVIELVFCKKKMFLKLKFVCVYAFQSVTGVTFFTISVRPPVCIFGTNDSLSFILLYISFVYFFLCYVVPQPKKNIFFLIVLYRRFDVINTSEKWINRLKLLYWPFNVFNVFFISLCFSLPFLPFFLLPNVFPFILYTV